MNSAENRDTLGVAARGYTSAMNTNTNPYRTSRDVLRDALTNGGGTYTVHVDGRSFEPATEAGGYFVGIHPGTFRTVWSGYRFARETIEATARAVHREYPGCRLGVWAQPSKQGGFDLHLDPVAWIRDREDALELGRNQQQQAVWDIAAGEEIPVTLTLSQQRRACSRCTRGLRCIDHH